MRQDMTEKLSKGYIYTYMIVDNLLVSDNRQATRTRMAEEKLYITYYVYMQWFVCDIQIMYTCTVLRLMLLNSKLQVIHYQTTFWVVLYTQMHHSNLWQD